MSCDAAVCVRQQQYINMCMSVLRYKQHKVSDTLHVSIWRSLTAGEGANGDK